MNTPANACRLRSGRRVSLTVAAGAVETLHGGVLHLPVGELQRGVQTPEALSQGVVLVVLDQLLGRTEIEKKVLTSLR